MLNCLNNSFMVKFQMNDRKPPHAPTVQHVSTTTDHNFARRRVRYYTTEVDQAISVHSRCPQPRKPSTPWPEVDIDSDVQESVRVNQELDSLHRRLAEERRQPVLEEPRPPSVAAEICSIPGSLPAGLPVPVPPTGPRPQIRRPHGHWDGHSARRGTGFRAAQEEPNNRNKEKTVSIPDKIRKQMKKYFS